MENLQLTIPENTSIETWNFDALKSELCERLSVYNETVYTEETKKLAKDDKASLNKLEKSVKEAAKAYKEKCLAPYVAIEPQIKEITSIIAETSGKINDTVKAIEEKQKQEKKLEIRRYYDKKSGCLGELAETLFEKLLDSKWLNASTSMKKIEMEIQTAISNAESDIKTIRSWKSPYEIDLLNHYEDNETLEQVREWNESLLKINRRAGILEKPDDDSEQSVTGSTEEKKPALSGEGVFIRVNAKEAQLSKVLNFMTALGIEFEVIANV